MRWQEEGGDVKCALGWVVAHASQYNIDTKRISMLGYSAGGNLVLLAAYSMGEPQLPPSCQAADVKIRANWGSFATQIARAEVKESLQ